MENLIYISIGAVAIVGLLAVWTHIRFVRMKKQVQGIRAEVDKLHHEVGAIKGRLAQAESIDLDLSVIENQMEENSQQMLTYVRGELSIIVRKIKDMDEQLATAEEAIDSSEERMDELESKPDEVEEEMGERLEDVEEKIEKKELRPS